MAPIVAQAFAPAIVSCRRIQIGNIDTATGTRRENGPLRIKMIFVFDDIALSAIACPRTGKFSTIRSYKGCKYRRGSRAIIWHGECCRSRPSGGDAITPDLALEFISLLWLQLKETDIVSIGFRNIGPIRSALLPVTELILVCIWNIAF